MKNKSKPALSKQIRVVIADDHPVVREGIIALVNFQKDMRVVSEATNGWEAVEQFLLRRPDVLLLDLRMPEMDGIEATRAIRDKVPEAKIIMLSTYDSDEDIYRALQAGAKAYLLKDSPRAELLECIRGVYSGQLSIPLASAARLAARMQAPKLTNRETDIIKLLVAGKSNKEIGATLGVTEGTVKVHTGHVFKKLGAAGRTEAIRIALERGIVHLKSENGL
jgi:two-component system NarL family response regulator